MRHFACVAIFLKKQRETKEVAIPLLVKGFQIGKILKGYWITLERVIIIRSHNQAFRKCEDLVNPKQRIQTFIHRQSDKDKADYRIRLAASINCLRYLLKQGLAFRGWDESDNSNNQGNFLELLHWLCAQKKKVKAVVLGNAPHNCKLTSPQIQKDIVNAVATETLNIIFKDIGDSLFSILVDESRDVSIKQQMAVALRYVDKNGHVVERFIGIQHVRSTTALSLKALLEELCTHKLSMSRLRGQGYDGASNMRDEFNGLKTLILKENEQAFNVHCFAHQLQLAIMAVAKSHEAVDELFTLVNSVVNVIGGSCKRCDMLKDSHAKELSEAFDIGDFTTGQGLHQESTLIRPSDTRWGSHYGTLVSLLYMYNSVIDVLETILEDSSTSESKGIAKLLFDKMGTYDFIFNIHLMKNVLAITNELSQALQRKDQDIVNAMKLVKFSKERLQLLRDSEWVSLLDEVSSFCKKYHVDVPNMEDKYVAYERPRRKSHEVTNLHHYKVGIFYVVIDKQRQELDDRFIETTTELLLCVACLSPCDSFSAFDKEKLLCLAQFYPKEFDGRMLIVLGDQLNSYIFDMRSSSEFSDLKGISDLAIKLVETKKDKVYQLVYLLLTLVLILPVATATVERAFSVMKIIKNRLRNKMGDQLMSDSLIVFIEKESFNSVDNETIIEHFQRMRPRRGQL